MPEYPGLLIEEPNLSAPADHPAKTIIEPPRGWQVINLREIWRYRELLYFLAWRDVKVRYKQTAIGALWAVLQPFLTMVVFSILFGRLMGLDTEGAPYPVFAYAALLPWTFFSGAFTRSGNSLISDANLISKVYFPRLILPFSAVLSMLVDFGIAFIILIGMMLYFARQFHICVRAQMRAHYARGGAWDHFPFFRELSGSTLGIIGLGRIGKELATRGKALGMDIIATTVRDLSDKPDYVDQLMDPDGLPILLNDSDFLVCCVPETGDTEYIMGYEEFKLMKKTAYFFNVGRGSAVNEDELVEALMDGLIAGAGLDTFEREPLASESYLWRMEGTLITPGISGIGPHFWKRTHDHFLNNLRHYLFKEPLEDLVDKVAWREAIDLGLRQKLTNHKEIDAEDSE